MSSTISAARASSHSQPFPTGSPSRSISQVPSPCPVTAIAATRLARSGTLSASCCSVVAVSAQVRARSCSAPPPGIVS
jgi:hypothetical protein